MTVSLNGQATNIDLEQFAKAIARELLHHLRQPPQVAQTPDEIGVYTVGPLKVDTIFHEVTFNGQPIELKHREFALLAFLAKNAGEAFTRDRLLELVWPEASVLEINDRAVDVNICRLRLKLGREAANLIRTIGGIGYKLQAPSSGQRPW